MRRRKICLDQKIKNKKEIKISAGNKQIVYKSQVVVVNAQIQMWQHALPMNGTDNGLHWHRIRSTKANTRRVQTTTALQQYIASYSVTHYD